MPRAFDHPNILFFSKVLYGRSVLIRGEVQLEFMNQGSEGVSVSGDCQRDVYSGTDKIWNSDRTFYSFF